MVTLQDFMPSGQGSREFDLKGHPGGGEFEPEYFFFLVGAYQNTASIAVQRVLDFEVKVADCITGRPHKLCDRLYF